MLKSLAAILFPETCPGCNSVLLPSEQVICTACNHNIPYTQHHEIPENEIFKRFYGRLPITHISALLYFNKEGIVQQLIHKLKYKGQQDIGKLMGQWYAPKLKKVAALQNVTAVIPVPLHPKKLRTRGYNQVAEFGKAIAEGLGVAYRDDILVRTVYNKSQTKKNLENRAAIIGQSFDVEFTENDGNNHFLLVDDVVTTGATLESCGRALLKIPNTQVSIVTIAYTHS